MPGFLKGNASPLTEYPVPPADALNAAGYGFYAAGIMEKLAATPYDEMIAGDIVWVGTPEDVIQRIRETIEVCEGLTEIAITTNPGGVEHWKAIKAQELFAEHVIPGDPARDRGGRGRGVTKVVVAGAGSIGSLLAAHLARVADVTVLTRREEHAAALREQGLRVSGRSDFTARLDATADPAALPADAELAILACKSTDLEPLAARLEGTLAGRDRDDDPERARRRGDRRGARRLAAPLRRHVHERHAPRRRARRVRPRHRDLDRAVPRHDRGRRAPGRRADRGRRAEGRGVPRPAARRSGRS